MFGANAGIGNAVRISSRREERFYKRCSFGSPARFKILGERAEIIHPI